ncbi:MAG: hypothetical protein A2W91_08550 [Bacteroidetes bacterium GWF2_38_335]|nr:MAG: hypothetical protein A2W91_08550 [Bacteroidetes bacterium GWF2_38_335]OFY80429.1 MAG: hypothetical protein A2281_08275 [Bacteroidetes bacterium RIFOXYA12_FULL_38_20]
MDYISSKLNQKINYLKGTYQKEILKVHYQANLEYKLFFILGYLWNKNWELLDPSDKEYCIENTLKPSIGSIVSSSRKLDLEKEIFGNKKEQNLYNAIDKYPNLRNERIGHGYSFEDDTETLLTILENLLDTIDDSESFLIKEKNDFILVLNENNGLFCGINFKSDGFGYVPWKCCSTVFPFESNSLYLLTSQNEYFKISPFVEIDEEGDIFIFSSIQEKLTGRVKYNKLLKTGILLKERMVFSSLLISNEKDKRKTANGTIINNFERNYKKFIDTGVKEKIKTFLLKNKSTVFGTIWGHGGVGKTATIQSLCEDLSNDDKKYFDYVIFVSAKDRYYNYYKGTIHELENNIDSFESIIKYVNKIIFDIEAFDSSSIINFEGKLLIIIDDFETFSKDENKNITNFIKELNINNHKIILTTRSATFVTGEEIKTNELSPPETEQFLLEAITIEIPGFNIDILKKDLQVNGNRESVHKITSGRPLFIFQFAILLAQKGSLTETLKHDIKSSKEAVDFLYDRIFDYLSADARNMFIAIGLLTKEDDLSNLIDKLKFITNKEKSEDSFQGALNELIKLKIIEIIDKDFFKVYSPEIFRLMKKYYESKGPEYDSQITTRFQLITDNKTLDTEWSLLENADLSRVIRSELEVENKYRYILNRSKTPIDIKLKAVLNFASYLVTHKGKTEKAIKLFEDYSHLFFQNPNFVKSFSQYCWVQGSIENKDKAIEILTKFFSSKIKVDNQVQIDLLGILMMYQSISLINEREDLKERKRYADIDDKTYKVIYNNQKERFYDLYKNPGLKLYNKVKDNDIREFEPYVRHSALEGLQHFVEICLRNRNFKVGKEVCQFVLDTLPQNFQQPFIFKLTKIHSMENPKAKIDPYKKVETEFGQKLMDALIKK